MAVNDSATRCRRMVELRQGNYRFRRLLGKLLSHLHLEILQLELEWPGSGALAQAEQCATKPPEQVLWIGLHGCGEAVSSGRESPT